MNEPMNETGMVIGKMSDEERKVVFLQAAEGVAVSVDLWVKAALFAPPSYYDSTDETAKVEKGLQSLWLEAKKLCSVLRDISDRYEKENPEA